MASEQCEGSEGKYVWPELLGSKGTVAKATIKRENSTVKVEIVVEGTIVPADLRCVADRVRVWVDTDGFVTRVPIIG
ncbi:glu S.griseus protease inhibitor-like [Pyrus x bretschneideri]|uniref:glu S.griseus protease inhibitor-like n=1 Tax=Pyrus x bretschneideri TaxID=225117 RepID=UPI0020302E93|nr:glu S.griseus protease inhibitor-like [Pyrus x bretschneideri]